MTGEQSLASHLKICQITSAHPVTDIRIFYRECRSLREAGHEVFLMAQHTKSEMMDGVKVVPLPPTRSRFIRILIYPWIILFKALRRKADIYHFHDPELLFIGFVLKLFGKKVVYDVHENVPLQFATKTYLISPIRWILKEVVRHIENTGVRFFDGIVTATTGIKSRFPGKYSAKIEVIGNYVDPEDIKPAPYSQKTHSLCYTGVISYNKGIDMLIKSVEVNYLTLNLAGKFENEQDKHKIIKMEGWENVNYYGFIDREQVKSIYDQSYMGMLILRPWDAFLDAMPNKLFEYMAAGIPIVASDFPLWKKIIEGHNCGICVNPLNLHEITKAISILIHNRSLARKMGQNGRDMVLKKYNWQKEKIKLFELYRKIGY